MFHYELNKTNLMFVGVNVFFPISMIRVKEVWLRTTLEWSVILIEGSSKVENKEDI